MRHSNDGGEPEPRSNGVGAQGIYWAEFQIAVPAQTAAPPSSCGLVCAGSGEFEVWVLKHVVKQDDEFAHDSG